MREPNYVLLQPFLHLPDDVRLYSVICISSSCGFSVLNSLSVKSLTKSSAALLTFVDESLNLVLLIHWLITNGQSLSGTG